MKYVKYSKYVPDPFDDLTAEDLMQMLGDFLLDSGFQNQYRSVYDMDAPEDDGSTPSGAAGSIARTGQNTRRNAATDDQNWEDYQKSELAEKINKLLERLSEEGYVSIGQPNPNQGEMMEREGKPAADNARQTRSLKLPTRRSTFLDLKRCGTCWDRLGNRASAGMIRASFRRAWNPKAQADAMSLATR